MSTVDLHTRIDLRSYVHYYVVGVPFYSAASINKKDTHLAENVCQVKCRVERESQTSFEKFLRSLPKVDTVDHTVDWVIIAVCTMLQHRHQYTHSEVYSSTLLCVICTGSLITNEFITL